MSSQAPRPITPRNIVPLSDEVTGASPVRATVPHLKYHGGPVLGAAEIVTIFWGPFWSMAAGVSLIAHLNAFFESILTSSLIDLLAEYDTPHTKIGHGKRVASFSDITKNPGTLTTAGQLVTDSQVQAALQQWIKSGRVPVPNANTLYFVYLPPAVISEQGHLQSCRDYCGYHNFFRHTPNHVYYAVEPFLSCAGCTYGTDLDSLTKVSSHELCEAITDPELNAWFDPKSGDEIGDICNSHTKRLNGYLVQTEWSNAQASCLLRP